MDEAVLKKVRKFLEKQNDNEAVFALFWEGTNEFYPPGISKTKVKTWLKEHPECFEIIANKNGDPFGKIKLKVQATGIVLPSTSKAEDKKIIQKLIESVDNKAENGHLFAIICKNKAEIFPEKLQDKKYIKQWLAEHEDYFKIVKDKSGGVFAVEVMEKARKIKTGPKPPSTSHGPPQNADLWQMANEIVLRISQTIEFEGGTIPFETLFKAKSVIYPLSDEESLRKFLSRFDAIFEIINIEGIGVWVQLKRPSNATGGKSTSDAVSRVRSFIFEQGGIVAFANLLGKAEKLIGSDTMNTSQALLEWLKANAKIFEIVLKPDDCTKPSQVKVKLSFLPRFCQNYITQGRCEKKNCQFLHICKAYICQPQHSYDGCTMSHNIRDAHNKVIIDKMGALGKETDDVVINVLKKSCFPRVCVDYSNKNGQCPRGENCHFLHVCGGYVLNQCPGCLLSHQVANDLHNIELLKKYALLPSKKLSEEMVKVNIAYVPVKKPQPSHIESFSRTLQQERMRESPPTIDVHEKKTRKRNRRRKRKTGNSSSTVDDADSTESDSNGDNESIASSSQSATRPVLSSDNIQKSNLTTALSGHQKVENWFGGSVVSTAQDESYENSDTDSSCGMSIQSSTSTQHLLWQDELEKKVFMTILDKYNGSVPFNKILKELSIANLEKWLQNHPHQFILNRNGRDQVDTVSVFSRKARLCLDYSGKHGCLKPTCGFFHICRAYFESRCSKACPLNHDVSHAQVKEVANRIGLQHLTPAQLETLIHVSIPTVCHYHNQEGGCYRGIFCPNLHVCKNFIKGRRHCTAKKCKYGHEQALKDSHATRIIKMYKLFGKSPNYKYIQKMIFVFDSRKRRSQNLSGQSESLVGDNVTEEPRVALMDLDLTEKIDASAQVSKVTPSICPRFLSGVKCKRKKCSDEHVGLPYCWQFKLANSSLWQSFEKTDCESIEKYFCDVNCTATTLNISTKITQDASSVHLDFQAMSGYQGSVSDSFLIRRLECAAKSEDDSKAWYRTQWTWYKLEGSKWIEEETNKVSAYEVAFLEGLIQIDSCRRRRPTAYMTESQVEEKRRSTKEQQTPEEPTSPTLQSPRDPPQPSSVPSQVSSDLPHASLEPPRRNIQSPDESRSCHRTRVEPGSSEYKDVDKLIRSAFDQDGLVVNQLERIVSDNLWKKYQSKKKSMTDELRPGEHLSERRLFVPCLFEDLDRIMRGNVHDSRIVLREQPLGAGYYFTSNPSLCLRLCTENATRSLFMIVCQVLLGTYTKGSSGLSEFPRRDSGRFYDSLVDNCDDPTVFVIKNVEQCYPAFVIDFSYVTTAREAESRYGDTTQFYTTVSPTLPSYEPSRVHAHPLATRFVPQSSNQPTVFPQQMTTTGPVDYVKAGPPYSERPPPQPSQSIPSEPPPAYTQHPHTSRSTVRSVQRPPGNSREDKDKCLVM